MTSPLSKDLVYLVLQFLNEEKFKEALHILEKESGVFFNMQYFENLVMNAELEEVEKYLRGFTRVEENRFSMKMFFEIRKQKYLEALDKNDHVKAVEILRKDLKLFETFNESLYKDITHLLTLRNFRENSQLSKYVDAKTARAGMMVELKRLLEANPHFEDKLQFPEMNSSRLRTLINQSLNWQHQLCKNPKADPEIKTLFLDHTCGQSSSVANPLVASVPQVGGFPSGSHGGFQPTQSPATSPNRWVGASISSSVPHKSSAGGPVSLGLPSNAVSTLKRPRSPLTNIPATDNQPAGRDHAFKRMRPIRISEEANNPPQNLSPIAYTRRSYVHSAYSSDDLPNNVVVNLSQGSAIKSMDFHPSEQTWLLVGTNIGDIAIWDVSKRERLIHRTFKVWDLSSCSIILQAILSKEFTVSVNRVIWSPDRNLFGVAYSKHIIHLYYYEGGNDLHDHLEIEAHKGNVGDIAFSSPAEQLYVVSCGEDKSVKVWDATTGSKMYTMEGHEAAVYSVCPHYRENVQFIFSTAVDGKIKAWLYDDKGARVQFDAPGGCCITMAYSTDGTRLFCCGTNKEGESHLVEWSESEGIVKRSYSGLGVRSLGVVQFDTVKNRFLAVGDESLVKIWDMDDAYIIKTIDADGGLPASPCVRFNKEGTLLAISTRDNGIKILANAEAPRITSAKESGSTDKSRIASSSKAKIPAPTTVVAPSSDAGTSTNITDKRALVTAVVAPVIVQDGGSQNCKEKSKILKLPEIHETSQLRTFRLPDNLLAMRVVRLIYTQSGSSILALQCNAVHKVWKWLKNENNTSGKATTAVLPQFWQPASGAIMVNDIGETSPEEAIPCFALSKNDSYTVSASGGKISLFNMMTFRTMTTILSPPPVATCIAFDPQDNNVIAIGMEDATIQIYHVRLDEVKVSFKGHQTRVTGLAFSNVLGVLVSSGADAQICVWSRDDWERKANRFLSSAQGRGTNPQASTYVQFHQDQTHLLAVHETQIAIYDATTLDCIKQWVPGEASVAITDATYSCDGQSVYASLDDGSVHILTAAKLQPKCQIKATAYLASPSRAKAYPVAIAAHPSEPNQFALGLSDGGVHVLEPLEAEGKWGNDALQSAEENSSASTGITPIVAEQVTPR